MERMKKFLVYVLLIVGFFAISVLLENGLIYTMYSTIRGQFDGYYEATNSSFSLDKASARASNVTGYINFDLINTTGYFVDQCYVKIDLYNQQNLLADTEYFKVQGLQSGDRKPFHIKFKANHVKRFTMSIVGEAPDKTNIINILGWEVDLTNVFGLGIDMSNVTIFGTRLVDIFKWNNLKSTGRSLWAWILFVIGNVPLWGYGLGWLFIVGLL